jgi:dephospho-CoA kinase
LVIGVTGSIGSGKSTVVEFLEQNGWQAINVDELAQEVIRDNPEIQNQIREYFGAEYINAQGELDRKKLAQIVFSDSVLIERLDDIVWPVLVRILHDQIRQIRGNPHAADTAVDMAVLFEAGCQKLFDSILVVTASRENRTFRLKNQRQLSLEEIDRRMNCQMDDTMKIKHADYVIRNNGNLQDLKKESRAFIQWINRQKMMDRKG